MRPEPPRGGPEVGLVGGAEDLGGLAFVVGGPEQEPSAPCAVFSETGDAYLVVVLDKHINIDFTMLAVQSAGRKIKNLGSMA